MNERRKKQLLRIVVALVVLWIAGRVILSVVRYVNNRKAHQEAEAWLQQAQQAAKPDMEPMDAVRWLKQNGAGEVYRGVRETVDGKEVEFHVIMASRKMSAESLWADPLTARLVFHFNTDWHFTNVELECLPYEAD